MVLLNGVKYACERCIRGHRVSSCAHTDKPLVMIKPKGRPASQCPHCRELRKSKNTHSSCNCGKKGRSPGTHLASCLCHKNAVCTCPGKEKKPAKKKVDTPSAMSSLGTSHEEISNEEIINQHFDQYLESDNGLLCHDPHSGLLQSIESTFPDESSNFTFGEDSTFLKDDQLWSMKVGELDHFAIPHSDTDLDLVEGMFPIFPSVGSNSFDDAASLPLLPIPLHHSALSVNTTQESVPVKKSTVVGGSKKESNVLHFSHNSPFQKSPSTPSHHENNSPLIPNSGFISTVPEQQPRSMKSSSSASNIPPIPRPRRPESVLSIASTSSSTSKHNSLDPLHVNHSSVSKGYTSGAFPPFPSSNNNSTDEFNPSTISSGLMDAYPAACLSDDDNTRSYPVHASSEVSLSSRQLLFPFRRTSLSRSHSQLHLNGISKDHSSYPLKTSFHFDSSPLQTSVLSFSSGEASNGKGVRGAIYQDPKADLVNGSDEKLNQAVSVEHNGSVDVNHSLTTRGISIPPEYQELHFIPMYQELFDTLGKGSQ